MVTAFTASNKSFYAAAADLIRAINQLLQSAAARQIISIISA